jgi:hypothetical protein
MILPLTLDLNLSDLYQRVLNDLDNKELKNRFQNDRRVRIENRFINQKIDLNMP